MSVGADLPIGTELAGYRIEALVGHGEMGVVYRALDLALERPVALKILAPELAADVGFRERFLRDSRLAASIDHPNVIPVFDAGEVGGELYIAMRYVQGSDLKRLLTDGPLSKEWALRIVSQVAAALDAAHARGLVHRDVKPSNVLVGDGDHVYLADFGLTKQLADESRGSLTGQIVGTHDYLAPEQIHGGDVDGRTDEYALACLLYQCLEGEPPFRRRTEAETLWAHMQSEPPPLADHPELNAVLARGLAKEPADRWQTCSELVAAARAAFAGEPTSPSATGAPTGTVTFLFTDIEGSTRLAKALGERWPSAIADHQGLLRDAFAACNGYEIDTQGDAFFIAFARAKDAVAAAVRGQAALASHPWGEGEQLTVRMGVHTGEAQLDEGRYRGVAVHRAARICAAAHGGQVLLSESTQRVLEDDPVRDVHLRDLGRHKLKDIDRPEHLFQAAAEGLRSDFPALRAERPVAWWRRRRVLVAAAAVLGAGAAVGAFLATSSRSPGGLARIDSNSVGKIDPRSGRIVSEVPVGTDPVRLAVGENGSLWVANFRDRTIEGIDPKTGTRTVTVPDDALVADLAVGSGSVWALSGDAGTVLQIDPRLGRAPSPIRVSDRGCEHQGSAAYCGELAAGGGSVWVTDNGTRLDRIDAKEARIVGHVDLERGAKAVAVAQGSVWVGGAGGVTRVDPARLLLIQSWATPAVSSIAVAESGVWAATGPAIVKIDPTQGLPAATIQIGTNVDAVATGAGAVWAVSGSSGKLYEIDPQRNVVVKSYRTGGVPTDVAVVGGSVWVSVA